MENFDSKINAAFFCRNLLFLITEITRPFGQLARFRCIFPFSQILFQLKILTAGKLPECRTTASLFIFSSYDLFLKSFLISFGS